MKWVDTLERLLPVIKDIIPNRFVWAMIVLHYGIEIAIVIIFLISWVNGSGQRSELLELLERL